VASSSVPLNTPLPRPIGLYAENVRVTLLHSHFTCDSKSCDVVRHFIYVRHFDIWAPPIENYSLFIAWDLSRIYRLWSAVNLWSYPLSIRFPLAVFSVAVFSVAPFTVAVITPFTPHLFLILVLTACQCRPTNCNPAHWPVNPTNWNVRLEYAMQTWQD